VDGVNVSGHRTFEDATDARELLRELVEERYPHSHRKIEDDPFMPAGGWVLDHDGAFALVRVPDIELTVISVRAGIAIEIPRSDDLALYVAAHNKQVMAGRVYLAYGEQYALVVLEEITRGRTLSWEFRPSMEDFLGRFDYVLRHAAEMRNEILARFGGRPFNGDEFFHLVQ
jgi:hypothetical protein